MALSNKQRKFTRMVAELIGYAYNNGMELTFGEAYRTDEQQALHVKSGRSKKEYSRHQERLAVDFNLFIDGKYTTNKEHYRKLGVYWEAQGGTWGGRFGVIREDYDTKVGWDANHFEFKG